MNLVTGATGHIGNVLVRRLLADGKTVRALVLPGEDRAPLEGLPVEIIPGDVLDKPSLHRAFAGVRTAYHLAGVISILPGENEFVRRVNVIGTQNILEAAAQAGVQRLLYTSSIHAITRVPHGVTIDEHIPFDPCNALSAYDRSKAEASLAVQQAGRQGLNTVIACPTGVIGPFDFRRSEMGRLIQDCMHSRVQWCVDGAYDFVDVRDVANGLVLACEKGVPGETYILSGEQITIRRLMDIVQEFTGRHPLRITLPLRLVLPLTPLAMHYYRLAKIPPRFTRYALDTILSNSVISCIKAKEQLGYTARSLHESIADSVHWFTRLQSASATYGG